MNMRDPKLTALQFNECINNQDLTGLARLMTDDHAFVDRDGSVHQPKQVMVDGWGEFFKTVPEYKNTFNRLESRDNLFIIVGFAYWSQKQPYDPVMWAATIDSDLVREWCIYADTEMNRKQLGLL